MWNLKDPGDYLNRGKLLLGLHKSRLCLVQIAWTELGQTGLEYEEHVMLRALQQSWLFVPPCPKLLRPRLSENLYNIKTFFTSSLQFISFFFSIFLQSVVHAIVMFAGEFQ